MKRHRLFRVIPFLCLLLLSVSSTACGSASQESYLQEVGELYRKAAEGMHEAIHSLEEAPEEKERLHAAVVSLEEASEAWRKTGHDLSLVRVPAGMEEFHSRLMELCVSGEELCRLLEESISSGGGEENAVHGQEGIPHPEEAGEEGTPGEGSHSDEEENHAPAGTASGGAH